MEKEKRVNEAEKKGTLHELPTPAPDLNVGLFRLKFQVVAIDDILPNPLQPAVRVQESALETLKNAVVESRVIVPPLVTPAKQRGQFTMVDGHRRWQVAKGLKISSLQVAIETERAPEELFVLLNSGTRPFKGNTWLTCWALAKDRAALLKRAPSKIRAQIVTMVDILGTARVTEIGKVGKQAPTFINAVQALLLTCERLGVRVDSRAAAEWTLNHGMTRVLWDEHRRMNKRIAERFAHCIAKDKDYPQRGIKARRRS